MDVHGPWSWNEEGRKKKKRWKGEEGRKNKIQLFSEVEAGPDQILAKKSLLPEDDDGEEGKGKKKEKGRRRKKERAKKGRRISGRKKMEHYSAIQLQMEAGPDQMPAKTSLLSYCHMDVHGPSSWKE